MILKTTVLSWWITVFGKTKENKTKHRDIKLVTKEKRRSYLVSVPNYYPTKFLTEKLLKI